MAEVRTETVPLIGGIVLTVAEDLSGQWVFSRWRYARMPDTAQLVGPKAAHRAQRFATLDAARAYFLRVLENFH